MRYAASRQKSCQQCSKAKARCDRNVDCCSRCTKRDLRCIYPLPHPLKKSIEPDNQQHVADSYSSPPLSHDSSIIDGIVFDQNGGSTFDFDGVDDRVFGSLTSTNEDALGGHQRTHTARTLPTAYDALPIETKIASIAKEPVNFTDLDLICPINADDISNRWLNQFVPLPGQKIKTYPVNVSSFIYNMLKSYATVVVRGHGVPPFIHSAQIASATICPLLSACISLVKICEEPLPGATITTTDVLQREMDKIYHQRNTFDDAHLLAAFQAYLIYSMVLFFQLGHGSNTFLRQAMMNLQEFACASSHRGLVCLGEQEGTHPKWEAWITAESKRRTLYTMYLFDSLLSSQENLPTFLGTELRGLPAPTNKILWQARTRTEWQNLYSKFLSDWAQNLFQINELWPRPGDLDDLESAKQNIRVERWLENLDEYGSMLYAVTCCTHGV